jgi:hypothetical protein
MTDYAATSVQPIVQGLLTVSSAATGSKPTFTGKGVASITRVVTAGNPAYLFVLDDGLPGNAGEVESDGAAYPLAQVPGAGTGALPGTNVPVPDTRSYFAIRGSSAATPPGSTTIVATAITWLNGSTDTVPPTAPSVDGGVNVFQLMFIAVAGATVDPNDLNAAGVEIVIGKRQPTA